MNLKESFNKNLSILKAAFSKQTKEPVINSGLKNDNSNIIMRNDPPERKGLKKSQKILDHMNSTELAANLFRATQTEEKLKRDNIKGKDEANQTHYEVGSKVRQTIKDLGGTMPEDLPTPEKSIKQIEKEESKKLTAKKKTGNSTKKAD